MARGVAERHGRIDILINNAGIESSSPFLEIDLATYERMGHRTFQRLGARIEMANELEGMP